MYFIGTLEDSRILELLLKYGASPDIKNKSGNTPLIVASSKAIMKLSKCFWNTRLILIYKMSMVILH
ncbi:hypothetical protein [Wolbachia endosymbiont of Mansonella perstans]|uniref:hypothetical protein n=1 Tax=Wolbachia endosymbiont of Mansonella perstans TaxID=229526 RepID=UPI0034CFCB68